jgi:hypothetical protein
VFCLAKCWAEKRPLNHWLGMYRMALIDDPQAWILRLFEMEEREGRGHDCMRFPEGARPSGIPLADGERVFGVYKEKYYFTPTCLIIRDKSSVERITWGEVCRCSSQHGEGKTLSDLTLADGRIIRVRVGDMATGWCGRISQLFHQMIERHGRRAAMGRPVMTAQEFFAKATDAYSIAPNLEPHPSLESFRAALVRLEQPNDGTRVLMDVCEEDDGSPVADAIVIVTPRSCEDFESFAESFGADGVVPADENTIRRVGRIPDGFKVWHVLWD